MSTKKEDPSGTIRATNDGAAGAPGGTGGITPPATAVVSGPLRGPDLATTTDLQGFFHREVERVVARRRAPVSEAAVQYLSALLVDQAHAEEPAGGTALADLRQQAIAARPAEAVVIWRRLGDYALVVAGFFRESLQRRSVDRGYYEEMGASAYRRVESRLWRAETGLFGELADRFHACTEVLSEVKEEVRDERDDDVLRLYERWLLTGSPRVAERLRGLGVVPLR